MATIIKSGVEFASGHDVHTAAYHLTDMSDHAQTYLDDVRQKAAVLVAEANQEADAIRQRAATEGRTVAMREVEQHIQQQVRHKLSTVLPSIEQLVETFQIAQQAWLAEWERGLVQLATAIASRVIRREVQLQPQITKDWITESLQLLTSQRSLTVRLHPEDHAALQAEVETLATQLRGLASTEIVSDPNISRGGCRVDAESGSVDQQIEAQLQRIEQELIGDEGGKNF
ncbi:MAG: flagellar assembly protein FliH [Pirellulaceae bacterium]|nr:flagellar assembly protein FliH [Pirellulaceae bacterium]